MSTRPKQTQSITFKKRKIGEFYWTKLPDTAKGIEALELFLWFSYPGKLQHKNIRNNILKIC